MDRLLLYRIAVILHAAFALFSLVLVFPALLGGPGSAGVISDIPQVVLVLGGLLAAVGLVSAYGAWRFQKWGIWLTIVVRAVDGISALPGILAAPSELLRLSAITAVVLAIFVIAVLLRRPQTQAVV